MTAWKNPVSGDWSVAANWSTDTVPTSADGATLWPPAPTLSRSAARIRPLGSSSMRLRAQLIENAGSLTLIGTLQVDSGFVSLNEASTLDVNLAASVFGGMLAFGSGAALGSGTVSLFGGELLASKDETLTNALNISDTSTIAATHGTTLIEDASSVTISSNSTLNIGSPGKTELSSGTPTAPAASAHRRPTPFMSKPAHSRRWTRTSQDSSVAAFRPPSTPAGRSTSRASMPQSLICSAAAR
jgi:hypothetical protein